MQLGAAVDVVEQWHWSVGAVALVGLDDGRRVALKAFPPRWTAPFLRGVVTVQRHLSERGLPCARPLAGPVPLDPGGAMVCAEEVVDDPGQPPHPFGEAELAASAAGLARLVTVAAELPRSAVAPLAMHPLRDAGRRPVPGAAQPAVRLRGDGGGRGVDRRAWRGSRSSRVTAIGASRSWPTPIGRLATCGCGPTASGRSTTPTRCRSSPRAPPWASPPRPGPRSARQAEADRHPVPKRPPDGSRRTSARVGRCRGSQRHAAGGSMLHSLAYTARCEHAVEIVASRARTAAAGARPARDRRRRRYLDQLRRGVPGPPIAERPAP